MRDAMAAVIVRLVVGKCESDDGVGDGRGGRARARKVLGDCEIGGEGRRSRRRRKKRRIHNHRWLGSVVGRVETKSSYRRGMTKPIE